MNHPGISEEELSAFIDGEVDPKRAAEIERLAAEDARLSQQIAALRSDKDRLLHIFEPVRMRPLPPAWAQLASPPAMRLRHFYKPAFSWRMIGSIAAAVLVILAFGVVYQLSPEMREDPIIEEAIAARQHASAPEQSLAGNELRSQETRDQVLARALAMMVKVPDLSRMGYQLADIQIYSGVPGGKAAELTYIDGQRRLFTLYLRHPSGPAQVDLIQRDRMRICIWQDDVIGTVMLGEMSAAEMARLASLAYSGLTL